MKTDLFHNKIIKDTATTAFVAAVENSLVSKLAEKYGEAITELQMYEDYLADGFVQSGEFYYPLTVIVNGDARREWVKWRVDKRSFENGVPYAYVGKAPLDIKLADNVPEEFSARLSGRGVYFEGGYAHLNIQAVSDDNTVLCGKYSQTFVDEMTRQLSLAIERAFSVSGLADSSVELHLVFAPGTYMEHVADGATYRRLLISARGCAARDFWIKWTRVGGEGILTASQPVLPGEIKFELGEDVPQKIKEKEYRFLVRSSSDKYQAAMGRKNITEWRDVIKRVIKRGELERAEIIPESTDSSEITQKLQELLGGYSEPVLEKESVGADSENSDLALLLKNALGVDTAETIEEAPADEPLELAVEPEEEPDSVIDITDEFFISENAPTLEIPLEEEEQEQSPFDFLSLEESLTLTETVTEADVSALEEAEPDEIDTPPFEIESEAEYDELLELAQTPVVEVEEPIPLEATEQPSYDSEEEMRRRIEAEIREKYELEAKMRMEEENRRLLAEQERLRLENERLANLAKEAEERLAREARERDEENERLRREIEASQKAEQRERERLAEAARLAVIEEQRRKRELEEEERLRLEAERNREIELERERILEERRQEEERIRREIEAHREEERLKEEEQKAKIQEAVAPTYTYTSKNARLIFSKPVDPNVTKRIHEIIVSTVKYFHKEDVYIKIKASIPDATTINLHFVKVPEEEMELVVNIIKVLGKSGLGITKVFLE